MTNDEKIVEVERLLRELTEYTDHITIHLPKDNKQLFYSRNGETDINWEPSYDCSEFSQENPGYGEVWTITEQGKLPIWYHSAQEDEYWESSSYDC